MYTLSHVLPLLALLLTVVTSAPTNSPQYCGTVVPPSNFYQIYEDPQFINQTSGLGPFYPSNEFSFATSQEANNVNERDLIASFKNTDGESDWDFYVADWGSGEEGAADYD
ncbi:MAG: hypothetical protein Q9218_001586 [Villophora microphyllina]